MTACRCRGCLHRLAIERLARWFNQDAGTVLIASLEAQAARSAQRETAKATLEMALKEPVPCIRTITAQVAALEQKIAAAEEVYKIKSVEHDQCHGDAEKLSEQVHTLTARVERLTLAIKAAQSHFKAECLCPTGTWCDANQRITDALRGLDTPGRDETEKT